MFMVGIITTEYHFWALQNGCPSYHTQWWILLQALYASLNMMECNTQGFYFLQHPAGANLQKVHCVWVICRPSCSLQLIHVYHKLVDFTDMHQVHASGWSISCQGDNLNTFPMWVKACRILDDLVQLAAIAFVCAHHFPCSWHWYNGLYCLPCYLRNMWVWQCC